MLRLLSAAKTWYIDGTFKVVKAPFTQLMSVHAFVRVENELKQFPLAFCLMSARRKRDYVAVIKELCSQLTTVSVCQVVSDFESAIWRAVEEALPGVKHRGCSFHWGQAVWRHIQELGLQVAYSQNDTVHKLCRKFLGLPFLPAYAIPNAFLKLENKATSLGSAMESLAAYIRSVWIDGNMWSPRTWSVYMQPVRTNNDCEGWHGRLNRKANRQGLNMYQLIKLLYHESRVVDLGVRLLSDRKVRRIQSKRYTECSIKLHQYWREFARGERSEKRLLSACSRLYGPVVLK